MSDEIKAPGFKSSDLIAGLQAAFSKFSDAEKQSQLKRCKQDHFTNGIFELQVTNGAKETVTWTIDMKKQGAVYKGKAQPKADVTIILSDETLVDLAEGKLNGQKAFMTGKLKTRGNMMLATKLDGVLKVRLLVLAFFNVH
ncbi:SCP2 sterol-binding domain-containing protein [Gymnopilus junonius]|uniref:SCP2 sterol-binding domain-containing protein n=1 Tax=Gymnopilus junonius TaxID=109634 RepID=A0A9P5TR26_GYMJU|nr:SCP2 sterol-binding domain-containing protein [Gymnopilus junonius]